MNKKSHGRFIKTDLKHKKVDWYHKGCRSQQGMLLKSVCEEAVDALMLNFQTSMDHGNILKLRGKKLSSPHYTRRETRIQRLITGHSRLVLFAVSYLNI